MNINIENIEDSESLEEVIVTLKKRKYTRDVRVLRRVFMRFKFFQDLEVAMGEDHVDHLLREVEYEQFDCRTVVFNQGELGRKFYIILSGKVSVLVRRKKETQE